jgi:hypothetical protein
VCFRGVEGLRPKASGSLEHRIVVLVHSLGWLIRPSRQRSPPSLVIICSGPKERLLVYKACRLPAREVFLYIHL